jgi:hypothetical protein
MHNERVCAPSKLLYLVFLQPRMRDFSSRYFSTRDSLSAMKHCIVQRGVHNRRDWNPAVQPWPQSPRADQTMGT